MGGSRLESQLTYSAVIEADPYDVVSWHLHGDDGRKTGAFLHGNGSIVPGGSPEDTAAQAASNSARCSRCQIRTSRSGPWSRTYMFAISGWAPSTFPMSAEAEV